jgi:hypothetical protein
VHASDVIRKRTLFDAIAKAKGKGAWFLPHTLLTTKVKIKKIALPHTVNT